MSAETARRGIGVLDPYMGRATSLASNTNVRVSYILMIIDNDYLLSLSKSI